MEKVTLLGIDIAKNIFQVHGVNAVGKCMIKKRLRRSELRGFVTQLPPCTIAMEACGGSHYWARQFQSLGHQVKLISPQFVKPFVKTNKTDAHDAEAITEAASRPHMRFVPIKNKAQQDIQSLHRIRSRLIASRTALTNQLRGLLAEYGEVIPQGLTTLRKALPAILDKTDNELTEVMRQLGRELYAEWLTLDQQIAIYDKKIKQIFIQQPICQKLAAINGIGPLSATILLTALSDPHVFKNGRQFAAFLGLVPKQQASGGKARLLGISKRGDPYVRHLLIHGARAVLKHVHKKTDQRSQWLKQLHERRGHNRTCVALANKNARMAWVLVANKTDDQPAA